MHIFIHLLNDFSGSPRIINEKIAAYNALGEECFVITNDDCGFIRPPGRFRFVAYRKHRSRLRWSIALLLWHLQVFWLVLRFARRGDVVHASTMLSAPHLVAARWKRARAVIHLMEIRVSPNFHKRVLCAIIAAFADRIVYLSRYVEDILGFRFDNIPHHITYPCVDRTIVDAARAQDSVAGTATQDFTVGMVCSMIWHKGYREFVALSQLCPDVSFVLVLNGDAGAFATEFPDATRPSNLSVHFNVPRISDVLRNFDLLISLTRREGWIETFGLTLVEGMTFSLPVIAPNVGAPREFVIDGVNGYLMDEADLPAIAGRIRDIRADPVLYAAMRTSAHETAARFTPARFREAVAAERRFVLR